TAAMDAVGFTVEIVEEVNAEYPEGTVTLQDPVEGDYWPLRDPIKLTVAKAETLMPNLVGKTLQEADDLGSQLGFIIGVATAVQTDDKDLKLKILSQSIPEGTVISSGIGEDGEEIQPMKVDVEYYSYEEIVLDPYVDSHLIKDDIINKLQSVGFVVADPVYVENTISHDYDNIIQSMTPEPGKAYAKGTTVTLYVYGEYVEPTSSETEPPSSSETEPPSSDTEAPPDTQASEDNSGGETPEDTGGGE
ncbi:MAG: PASTA domain-containing protein, partial [Lachnospiraceae bacterium]|nr:PASTA domain-containing protein [Lachnospiraceae bacterium]